MAVEEKRDKTLRIHSVIICPSQITHGMTSPVRSVYMHFTTVQYSVILHTYKGLSVNIDFFRDDIRASLRGGSFLSASFLYIDARA